MRSIIASSGQHELPAAAPKLLLLVALGLSPLCVHAGIDDPGIYLGGGVGYNRIESEDFPNDDDDIEDSRVSYKGIVGMRLGPMWSIEGQYIDFGTAEDGANRVKADGWSAGAVFTLPLFEYINPYAKAGALFWDADGRSGNVIGPAIEASDDGTDFTYGVGVGFALSNNLQLRTEYERFELSDTGVDMGSANLVFSF